MKLKFTYKELTLILGILVAVIVMLTVWLRPSTSETNEAVEKPVPSIAKPAASIFLQKAYVVVTETLR